MVEGGFGEDTMVTDENIDVGNTPLEAPVSKNGNQLEGIDTNERDDERRKEYKRLKSQVGKLDKAPLKDVLKAEEALRAFGVDSGDELVAQVEKFKGKRTRKYREPLVKFKSGGNGPRSVKDWDLFVTKCRKELAKSDPLLVEATESLAERERTHRKPIVDSLSVPDLVLRKLRQIERRCAAELPDSDELNHKVAELIKSREKSHKSVLVAKYTKLMRSKLKDVSVRSLTELLKKCEEELDPSDPLLAQARSACEARVLDKGNPSKVKSMAKDPSKKSKKFKEKSSDDIVLYVGGGPSTPSAGSRKGIVHPIINQASSDPLSLKLVIVASFIVFTYILVQCLQIVIQVAPFIESASAGGATSPAEATSAKSVDGSKLPVDAKT
uniref:Uncharacterized protein n=1 Tax=Mucochytrium quahogii TaxID=96639 RepID=A0A7S2WG24_9STRA|mmetsp:Transcript_13459/g.21988  ORF Transcript_13459/g.21988 Transcript_13459/m.21988 type:complete len:383 (-) Transcript_13459:8-1156(-)